MASNSKRGTYILRCGASFLSLIYSLSVVVWLFHAGINSVFFFADERRDGLRIRAFVSLMSATTDRTSWRTRGRIKVNFSERIAGGVPPSVWNQKRTLSFWGRYFVLLIPVILKIVASIGMHGGSLLCNVDGFGMKKRRCILCDGMMRWTSLVCSTLCSPPLLTTKRSGKAIKVSTLVPPCQSEWRMTPPRGVESDPPRDLSGHRTDAARGDLYPEMNGTTARDP